MRGAVFAQKDGVVREHEDLADLVERREAQRGFEIVEKVEERRREGQQSAVQRDPARCRGHRVLAHAVVDVATGVGTGLEIALALEVRLRRRIEVRRTAHELGECGGDRVHHRSARVTRRHRAVLGVERRPGQLGRQRAVARALELRRELRVARLPGLVFAVPLRLERSAAGADFLEERGRFGGDLERRVRPAQRLARRLHVFAQRLAVRLVRAGLGRSIADRRAHRDQRRTLGGGFRLRDRAVERLDVVRLGGSDLDRLPAVGLEALANVLGKRHVGRGRERNHVLVVEDDQLGQREMTRQRGRLRRHPFHEIAVSGKDEGVMVDDRLIAVVDRGEVRLGDCQTHRVREALAQRSGGDLDPGGVVVLGVARRAAA